MSVVYGLVMVGSVGETSMEVGYEYHFPFLKLSLGLCINMCVHLQRSPSEAAPVL